LEEIAGRLSVEELKRLASSHRPASEAVCRHAIDGSPWETAATMICEPALQRLHISFGPPCEGRFSMHTI
jgi:hypothetical protein